MARMRLPMVSLSGVTRLTARQADGLLRAANRGVAEMEADKDCDDKTVDAASDAVEKLKVAIRKSCEAQARRAFVRK